MKSDKDLLKIMDHLDGISGDKTSKEHWLEAKELQQVLDALKKLPVHDADLTVDKEFYSFIETQKARKRGPNVIRQLWPYVALVASLALLLYLFIPKNLFEQYAVLETNADKVGFIYDLYDENISKEEYLWLYSLLGSEESPNIRVTLIDLIEQQEDQVPTSIAQLLVYENIPAVQMALLNTIDLNYNPGMEVHLLAFNDREDLDQLVKQRTADILNEK